MKITAQSIKRAIVPLFMRTTWPLHEVHYSDLLPQTDPEYVGMRNMWIPLWGLYSYRDAAGNLHTVEAQALISKHWHDFCGGLLVSSANVYTHSGTYRGWEGLGSYASWGIHRRCNFPNVPDSIPSLHDFLRAKHLTDDQAIAIMRRSLAAAIVGRAVSCGKMGVLAMDRVEYAPRTRTVMREARNLTWVYGQPIQIGNHLLPHLWDDSATANPLLNVSPNDSVALVGVNVTVQDEWSYINRNSGQRVGPVLMTIELTEEYGKPYPDDYWDDEDEGDTCTYQPLPGSVLTAQRRKDYVRLMPARLFNNG